MTVAKTARPDVHAPSFGTAHRPRRRALPPSPKSDSELIAEYLKRNQVTRCETRHAEGSVQASGYYAW